MLSIHRFLILFILLFSITLSSSISMANPALMSDASSMEKTSVNIPADSFGRETPRKTVQGFLAALSSNDTDLAIKYLDDDYLKQKGVNKTETVERLRNSLNVGGRLAPMLQINDTTSGNLEDLMPPEQDKVGEIDVNGQKIDIIVVQRTGTEGNVYWQFSEKTLENLPKDITQSNKLIDELSINSLKKIDVLGATLSDIIALLFLIALSLSSIFIMLWMLFGLMKTLYPKITGHTFAITPKVVLPLSIIVIAILLPEIMLQAGVPVTLRIPVGRINEAVAWIASTWLIFRLIDGIFNRAQAISQKRNRSEQVSLLILLRKLAKVFMLILAVITVLGNLGFDLTTGIAALGVGGLALAFGAQKTIENLIGSMVIVADRPVRVGDYCNFGTFQGTVLDIGIRSTRVQTLNRTIVTIPNGEFSSLQIENYTPRDMYHFLHVLHIKRDTSLDLIETLLRQLKKFLDGYDTVNSEWTQVRISELKQDAFIIEIRAYLNAVDVIEFYDRQSQLLLDILRQVDNLGIEYALPTQSLHMTINEPTSQQPSSTS